jgi:hypothetical protein
MVIVGASAGQELSEMVGYSPMERLHNVVVQLPSVRELTNPPRSRDRLFIFFSLGRG